MTVERATALENIDTPIGEWAEVETVVEVNDGRLSVEIGRPGGTTNTCLNWLRIVSKDE